MPVLSLKSIKHNIELFFDVKKKKNLRMLFKLNIILVSDVRDYITVKIDNRYFNFALLLIAVW